MKRKVAKNTTAKNTTAKNTTARRVQKEPKPLFKVGDVVRLKSGGPAMTIEGTYIGEKVRCEYMPASHNYLLQAAYLTPETLMKCCE